MTEPPAAVAELDEDRFHVVASASLSTGGSHVLKAGDTFVILDRLGDIRSAERGEQGLYHRGTKYLSRLRLSVARKRPLLLSSSMRKNNLVLDVDLTNPEICEDNGRVSIASGGIHLARSKFVDDGRYYERLVLANYSAHPVRFELALEYAADFVDIFEVRGTRRERRGTLLPAETDGTRVTLAYRGLDRVVRQTRIDLSPAPAFIDAERATFSIRLESKCSQEIFVAVACAIEGPPVAAGPPTYDSALARSTKRVASREAQECQIQTSNEPFNDWVARSQADLRMLLTDTPQGPYPYAGVPWFSTPFGRDAIWTALETLWVDPSVAAGVLRFLSAHQATRSDAAADAEPGKILHEMRDGEMAALHEIPFGRYYGSIDSTPLYLMLAGHYHRATGDRSLIESIWPNLLSALEWVDRYGDLDGDGFVEYGKRSKDGLVQQGWKDSADSVFHRDGTAAAGPIALCEVQAYVHAALHGMADLAEMLGEESRAVDWRHRATALDERFEHAFWCEDLSTYALALDGKKQPCRVETSNAGHCLYAGIASRERADRLAKRLLSETMFSGWGVRTLASNEERYNPMAYHNGSVWPHDNAILAAGLARYGYRTEAATLLTALFDAALAVDLHRLPELFCGFARQTGQGPTLYPVACSPQAWASGAIFMLLQAVLGFEVDAVERRVVFRHTVLPPFLEDVRIRNLRVGDALLDLRLQRHPDDVGITVTRKSGKVEVVAVK